MLTVNWCKVRGRVLEGRWDRKYVSEEVRVFSFRKVAWVWSREFLFFSFGRVVRVEGLGGSCGVEDRIRIVGVSFK